MNLSSPSLPSLSGLPWKRWLSWSQLSPKKGSVVSYSRAVPNSDASDGARGGDHSPHGFSVSDPHPSSQTQQNRPELGSEVNKLRASSIRHPITRGLED